MTIICFHWEAKMMEGEDLRFFNCLNVYVGYKCVYYNLSVVVWNVNTKESICGSPAQHKSAGITYCLAASRSNDNIFFTAGK